MPETWIFLDVRECPSCKQPHKGLMFIWDHSVPDSRLEEICPVTGATILAIEHPKAAWEFQCAT